MTISQEPVHNESMHGVTHWMHSCSEYEYNIEYERYLRCRLESEALEQSYHDALQPLLHSSALAATMPVEASFFPPAAAPMEEDANLFRPCQRSLPFAFAGGGQENVPAKRGGVEAESAAKRRRVLLGEWQS